MPKISPKSFLRFREMHPLILRAHEVDVKWDFALLHMPSLLLQHTFENLSVEVGNIPYRMRVGE